MFLVHAAMPFVAAFFSLFITVFAVMAQVAPLMGLSGRVASRPDLHVGTFTDYNLLPQFSFAGLYLVVVIIFRVFIDLGLMKQGFASYSFGGVVFATIMLVLAFLLAGIAWRREQTLMVIVSGVLATLGAVMLVRSARLQLFGGQQVSLGKFFNYLIIGLVVLMLLAAVFRRLQAVLAISATLRGAVVVGAVMAILKPHLPDLAYALLWLLVLVGLVFAFVRIIMAFRTFTPIGGPTPAPVPPPAGSPAPRRRRTGLIVTAALLLIGALIAVPIVVTVLQSISAKSQGGATAGGTGPGDSSLTSTVVPETADANQAEALCAVVGPDGTLSGGFNPTAHRCESAPAAYQVKPPTDFALVSHFGAAGNATGSFGTPVCTDVRGTGPFPSSLGETCILELMGAVSHDPVLASTAAQVYGLVPGVTSSMTVDQRESQRVALANQLKDEATRRSFIPHLWGAIAFVRAQPYVESTSGAFYRAYRNSAGKVWQEEPTLVGSSSHALVLQSQQGETMLFSLENGFAPMSQQEQLLGIPFIRTSITDSAYVPPQPAEPTMEAAVLRTTTASPARTTSAAPKATRSRSALPDSGVSDPQGPAVVRGTTAAAGPQPTPVSGGTSAPAPGGGTSGASPEPTTSPDPTGNPPPPAG